MLSMALICYMVMVNWASLRVCMTCKEVGVVLACITVRACVVTILVTEIILARNKDMPQIIVGNHC